jgi:Spy/CpxP family protein refolding chaperone
MRSFWRTIGAACAAALLAVPGWAQAPAAPPPPAAKPPAPAAKPPAQDTKPPAPGAKPPATPAVRPAAKPPTPKPLDKPNDKPKPPRDAQEVRDKLRLSIREMRAKKLAEVLKPDPNTAQRLQEISEKYGDDALKVREQAGATRRELKKLVEQAKPDPTAVTQLTDQYLTQRGKAGQLESEREAAVRGVLTPDQFARYLIAWPKINRQIQDLINQALRARGKPAGGDEL